LTNTKENTTVAKAKKFYDLNTPLAKEKSVSHLYPMLWWPVSPFNTPTRSACFQDQEKFLIVPFKRPSDNNSAAVNNKQEIN
jgi:hypothetical protein